MQIFSSKLKKGEEQMALVSPGVQVSVTDESFFSSAGPGTVPLIFIATKQDKLIPDGTAVATGTSFANADSLFVMSSQRELLQTFGDPDFNLIGGSAQNGYPLNEYGLLAAYSYLGLANRAFVIRADIDLAQLDPLSIAPTADPADNTYWNNTNNFVAGLFQRSSSGTWDVVTVSNVSTAVLIADGASEPSSGWANGDVIVNFDAVGSFHYMERAAGVWEILGQAANRGTKDFQWAPHTFVPILQSDDSTALATGDWWLKTTSPNNGLSVDISFFDSSLAQFVSSGTIPISDNHVAYYALAGVSSASVPVNTVVGFVDSIDSFAGTPNTEAPTPQALSEADVAIEIHNGNSTVVLTGTASVSLPTSDAPSTFVLNGTITGDLDGAGDIDALVILLNNEAALTTELIVASKSATDQLILTATDGRDIVISSPTSTIATALFITAGTTSNFSSITLFEADTTQPVGAVTNGTYWFDPSFIVDILENDGAGAWIEFDAGPGTNIFVQSDDPVNNIPDIVVLSDLWLETDKLDNYPVLWRRNADNDAWVLIDNSDQTTPLGVVFADARADSSQSATDLDLDAPDPLLFPGGMLLFNTRFSGRNVKQWTVGATALISAPTVPVDRWVSVSGNNFDGSLISGSDAQKAVVVKALNAVVISNQQIRDDTIFYNLLAAPGYPELMDEMLSLNVDRKEQAFVIGDSPFNLADNATALQAWASNSGGAAGNGDDGLVSADSNLAVYYPSGLTTNTDGTEVVVPASHMILRTMAFNDQVSYPWFAPAGFTRGTISNASAVGYLDSSDAFIVSSLNEGQRDTLQLNNVNPIATIPNRGLVVFGQKTRQGTASALDRVNVARLINHIRFQADQLAQPFLFEPNDSVTRGAVKEAFDSFLSELVTLRGLQDFLVVVDESNNTPARIDRSELWIDLAVQPIKSIEFIFIPIRIKSVGDDLNL